MTRARAFTGAAIAAWVGLQLAVAWHCRYWINSDTIGSLDAARSLRALDPVGAINGYFGSGLAALLAPLDLKVPQSFLSIHLVTVALLLATQWVAYLALRAAAVPRGVSALLTTAWVGACYATGCALYVTADVALAVWTGLYVLVVMKQARSIGAIVLLGVLHAIAGATRAIAFPALAVFAVGAAVAAVVRLRGRGRGWGRYGRRLAGAALAYSIPFGLLTAGWVAACHARYGAASLGGTGSYNYALYTTRSPSLLDAIEHARHQVLPGRSSWWSDPTLSVRGWDRTLPADPIPPARRVAWHAAHYLWPGKQSTRAAVLTALLLGSVIAIGFRSARSAVPVRGWLLAASGVAAVLPYATITLLPRHLTFPALLCLPTAGILLGRLVASDRPFIRRAAWTALVAAVAHGVATMVHASFFLAPDDTHFAIARTLREEARGPIGAHAIGGGGERAYGTIAFLTGRSAAEITTVGETDHAFHAGFDAGAVLLIRPADTPAPPHITVNGRPFVQRRRDTWSGGTHDGVLGVATYLPDAP